MKTPNTGMFRKASPGLCSLCRTTALMVLSFSLLGTAFALKDESNQGRWEKPCKDGPDAVVPGFLINMGPTGARGELRESSFVVKYIFKKSPASDVLELDDEVYGANGKTFSKHTFGGGDHGIEGPIQDLGLAIEDSEGDDGVLHLMVRRGGSKLKLDVQLEKLGRFADTFPVNCAKTEILKNRANKYLMDHQDGLGPQGRCAATLALLSSDDPKMFNAGKRMALDWNEPYNKSTWSWYLGFQGIALAEYYLLTGDKKVLDTLENTSELLVNAQWKAPIHHWKSAQIKNIDQQIIDKHQALYEGGFGHAPYPEIVERGGGGYGPMQWPTCLALMTWHLAKQCGLEVDQEAVDRSHQFLDFGTNAAGRIAYGGEFTLNNGPIDWERWNERADHGASHKSGLGYLVHILSSGREESGKMMDVHLQNIDASFKDMPDGHACALMGLTWGWAGTYASDDAGLKKKVSDYYKAWMNMARCHGSDSYVILPARDYADLSYYRGNIRNHTTAAVAFAYSYSTPKLRVQGQDGNGNANSGDSFFNRSKEGNRRLFYNPDRTRSFEGMLVRYDSESGEIQIRMNSGKIANLELTDLSEDDQKYVKEFGK